MWILFVGVTIIIIGLIGDFIIRIELMEFITKLESNNPDDVQFARQKFHDLFGIGEMFQVC